MIVPGYAPGDWYAVVSDGTVVLLPPETDATVLDQMWTSLREHTDLTDHLGVLTRERITSLPPFAMVSVVAGLVRVIVRGDVEVEVVGDRGSRVLTAPDVSTWSEAVVQGALAVTVRADSAADAPEASLAVLSAVVRASQVRVGLRADVGTAAGADAAAAPAPEAPGRGQSGRRAHAALEPDAEPSVSEASVGEASSTEPFSTEPSLPEPTTAGGEPATPAPAVDEHATGEQTDASPASVEPTPAATLPPPAPAPAPAPPAAAPAQPAPAPTPPPLPAPAPSAPVPSPWSPVQRPAAADPTEMTVAREPRKEVPTAGPGPRSGIEVPAPVPAHDDDHDGLTVHSSDVVALRRQLPEWAGDAVPGPLAVPAAEQGPPAKILMSSGLVVALNRPVLIGRAPQVSRVTNSRLPRLVTVSSPNQDISRTHAEVRQEGEDVVVTDLRSTNGVLLLRQGAGPQRLHPGEPTVVEPGVVVDLGEGVTFVVERGA